MSHSFTQFMLSQYKSHTFVSNINTRMITAIKYSYVTLLTTLEVNVFLQMFDKVFACHFESIFIYLFLWLHNPKLPFQISIVNVLFPKSFVKMTNFFLITYIRLVLQLFEYI